MLSLATLLLRSKPSEKEKAIDTELDALFHSSILDRPESTSNDRHPIKKKKRNADTHADRPDSKRPRSSLVDASSSSLSASEKPKKSVKKRVRIAPEPVLLADSDTSDAPKVGSSSSRDPSALAHENFRKEKRTKPAGNRDKNAPSDETRERRDARTIFIGNLVPDVVIKRPLQKQLRRYILAFVPTAKIQSTRFRSVAFQTPTSKHPGASDEPKKNKQARQHDRDRASSWRDAHAADTSKTDEKKFLTPSQKKKIAFINRDIHSDADSVHAYIVFAYPPLPRTRQANLPPPPPVMDPFEAARLVIEKCDGTVFLDHMLRVDAVVTRATTEGLSDKTSLSLAVGDPKLTIFVGNLEFASKEEDLRAFFEGIMSAERGPPDGVESQDGDKLKCWVTHVRVIRDKDTQLGKGFAYVQFLDRTCVDEVLALEPEKLKFAKRRLRVQRCKLTPNKTPTSKSEQAVNRAPVSPLPKGDSSLGEKLAQLTKEERKRIKTADADRIARRMTKKRARMALAKQGISLQTNQRERVRKTKKTGGAPSSKRRVRSEKSIAKKNVKK